MPALASPEGAQTQQDLLFGRKTPLLALAAPAAGAPRGERPEAGAKSALVPVGQAAKLLVADRTAGRGGVGLGDSLALQFQALALYLDFQMTEVLILGDHKRFGRAQLCIFLWIRVSSAHALILALHLDAIGYNK